MEHKYKKPNQKAIQLFYFNQRTVRDFCIYIQLIIFFFLKKVYNQPFSKPNTLETIGHQLYIKLADLCRRGTNN